MPGIGCFLYEIRAFRIKDQIWFFLVLLQFEYAHLVVLVKLRAYVQPDAGVSTISTNFAKFQSYVIAFIVVNSFF